jgi:hypothetical protein
MDLPACVVLGQFCLAQECRVLFSDDTAARSVRSAQNTSRGDIIAMYHPSSLVPWMSLDPSSSSAVENLSFPRLEDLAMVAIAQAAFPLYQLFFKKTGNSHWSSVSVDRCWGEA